MTKMFRFSRLLASSVRFFSTSEIHPTSQVGFDKVASQYDKGRPSYPKVATDLLLQIKPNENLLEIGSGSGKFTSILGQYFPNSNLTCVEPVEKFRDMLNDKFEDKWFKSLRVVDGSASNLTQFCGEKSMDAILVGQAFHWFATNEILQTFSKVLKTNGFLYLIWTQQVFNTNFLMDLKNLININQVKDIENNTPIFRVLKNDIENLFNGNEYFNDSKFIVYENSLSQIGDYNMIINRILSKSSFAVKTEDERENIRENIKDLVMKYYKDLSVDNIELPYDTYVIMTQCKV